MLLGLSWCDWAFLYFQILVPVSFVGSLFSASIYDVIWTNRLRFNFSNRHFRQYIFFLFNRHFILYRFFNWNRQFSLFRFYNLRNLNNRLCMRNLRRRGSCIWTWLSILSFRGVNFFCFWNLFRNWNLLRGWNGGRIVRWL
jgi:hypothetical protein